MNIGDNVFFSRKTGERRTGRVIGLTAGRVLVHWEEEGNPFTKWLDIASVQPEPKSPTQPPTLHLVNNLYCRGSNSNSNKSNNNNSNKNNDNNNNKNNDNNNNNGNNNNNDNNNNSSKGRISGIVCSSRVAYALFFFLFLLMVVVVFTLSHQQTLNGEGWVQRGELPWYQNLWDWVSARWNAFIYGFFARDVVDSWYKIKLF